MFGYGEPRGRLTPGVGQSVSTYVFVEYYLLRGAVSFGAFTRPYCVGTWQTALSYLEASLPMPRVVSPVRQACLDKIVLNYFSVR